MERSGHSRSNVTFLQGFIETLGSLGLERETFDVVISNCVVNLSIDKLAVLKGVFDLLKPGGEFYFADVYADRRLPKEVRDDPVVYGECLGGALYWNDFLRLAKQAGFGDPRLVTSRLVEITDPDVSQKVGAAKFYSATYRLFKLLSSRPPARTTGRRSSTKAASWKRRKFSISTAITQLKKIACSRSAGIPGTCYTRPALPIILISSETSGRITAYIRDAARTYRSRWAVRPARTVRAAADHRCCSKSARLSPLQSADLPIATRSRSPGTISANVPPEARTPRRRAVPR